MRHHGKVSVDEFLALIEARPGEERWQLIDGEPMSLPQPTLAHRAIASNLMHALNEHFRSRNADLFACFGVGVMVPGDDQFRVRADIAVLDATLDAKSACKYYADKFYLVAEVLSDNNTDKDSAVKRQRYLQHPDNLYFVLIEQKRVRVAVLARAAGWQPVCSIASALTSTFPNGASRLHSRSYIRARRQRAARRSDACRQGV